MEGFRFEGALAGDYPIYSEQLCEISDGVDNALGLNTGTKAMPANAAQ